MAFDKEEIEGIMQVSTVIKPKIPVGCQYIYYLEYMRVFLILFYFA